MQPFPHSSDATHKIWSRLASWLQRYTGFESVDEDGRGQTDDGPLLYYKLTLWAFGSGELIKPDVWSDNIIKLVTVYCVIYRPKSDFFT